MIAHSLNRDERTIQLPRRYALTDLISLISCTLLLSIGAVTVAVQFWFQLFLYSLYFLMRSRESIITLPNYYGAQLWDKLPIDTQSSGSFDEFKRKVKRHIAGGLFEKRTKLEHVVHITAL